MKLVTIKLDKDNPAYSTYNNNELQRQFLLPKANYLKIFLIEIDDSINPTDLTLEISYHKNPYQCAQINFSRIRTRFIHQKDTFILDASSIGYLKVDINAALEFTIKADAGGKDFSMRLYCETDQPLNSTRYTEVL